MEGAVGPLLVSVLAVHLVSAALMAHPYYALVFTNERGALGEPGKGMHYRLDRYFENVSATGFARCCIFQWTAGITGVVLAVATTGGLAALAQPSAIVRILFSRWEFVVKIVLLVYMVSARNYLQFVNQPKIDRLLDAHADEEPIPGDVVAVIKPFRVLRKRLSASCLFVIVTLWLLGLSLSLAHPLDYPMPVALLGVLVALGFVFTVRVFHSTVRNGWF